MKSGWYNGGDQYFVVKPLHNGNRQSLIVGATNYASGRWYIMMGVFSSNATYNSMYHSEVWHTPTSTNKNPAVNTLSLALEALSEIEQVIHNRANGKRAYVYVDGLDERRLRVYTKVLTKKCGYKKSTAQSDHVVGMPMIYKRV
jgi:hypothetical protein